MTDILEIAANFWIFGVPVMAATWAILRLTNHLGGRTRYLIAIAAFCVAAALPFSVSFFSWGHSYEPPDRVDPATPSLVLTIWIIGTFLFLARDAAGHVRIGMRKYRPAPDDLRRRLEWPEDEALFVGAKAPMTIGLLRPRVIMPESIAATAGESAARCIARHELSHVRWRDPLVFAALRALAAVFWIAPLWPLLHWIRREREAAADDAALADTGNRETYVSALVAISRVAGQQRTLAATVAGNDLETRARRILDPPRRRVSAVAALVLLTSAASLFWAPPASYSIDRDDRDEQVIQIRRVIRR